MKFKIVAAGLALAFAALTPVHAQRGGNGTWELLGEERVGLGNDRDVINLGKSEDYYKNRSYRRLRFVVEGGEVRMKSVRLVFLNGHNEDLDVSRTLKPGENFDVDLRSERSYLQQIQLNYTGKFGFSLGGGGLRVNQATVRIFGENTRGGGGGGRDVVATPPRTVIPPGWSELAREGFDRRDGSVEIRVSRREGRIGQIRFQNDGDKVDIREVTLRFGNGETQNIRLNSPLDTGEVTRPIDIEGDRRRVESISLRLNPGRRSGQAELIVLGTERAGREDSGRSDSGGGGRRDWIALGEQTVGFGVDRDVIRINQSEDFYRNKGFDKLHFVAERSEVHMMAIRIVYMNGHNEDIRVDRLLRPGADLAVDLPGSRSYIRAIEMTYRSRPGYSGQAVVKVFGEAAQGRR